MLNICKYIIGVLLVIYSVILMITYNNNAVTIIPVSTLAYGACIVAIQTLKIAFHAVRYETKPSDIDPEFIIITNIICMAATFITLLACTPLLNT